MGFWDNLGEPWLAIHIEDDKKQNEVKLINNNKLKLLEEENKQLKRLLISKKVNAIEVKPELIE